MMAMASSSSAANQSPMVRREAGPKYLPYPPPLATYEDVMINRKLFMDTLEKLHITMGTKFMIPIIGGKDLDLHRLFVEVTSRGGIDKVIRERRWKEVTGVFSFPSTATNASFVLRKYYVSLLHHYEQIYYFKSKGWCPADHSQNLSSLPAPPQGYAEQLRSSPQIQAQRMNVPQFSPIATSATPTGSQVIGVIDGKFESGYLITVTIGSEKLKGVLYQVPQSPASQMPQNRAVSASNDVITPAPSGVHRRRRRKKSEMKKRDPSHPKPNRSGYNFFFAEQHARLKPLYPGKDRDISRMIGELWTNLKESEKSVYQEQAMKDKERYRTEMEDYRERLRAGQIISSAVPIEQRPLTLDINIAEPNDKTKAEGGGESPQTTENEINSDKSSKSDSEDNAADDQNIHMDASPGVETGTNNPGVEDEKLDGSGDVIMEEGAKNPGPEEVGESTACAGKEPLPPEERDSVSGEGKASECGEDQ